MVERIRELLKERQLTPTQFADTIGIGRPVVSHILSGRNKPSLEVVQKVIGAFPDVALPWLLNGEGPMWATASPTQPTQAPIDSENSPVAARSRKNGGETSKRVTTKPQPSTGERIAPLVAPAVAPADTPTVPPVSEPVAPTEATAAALATAAPLALGALLSTEKPIRRIVIFYRDGTFSDYQPES